MNLDYFDIIVVKPQGYTTGAARYVYQVIGYRFHKPRRVQVQVHSWEDFPRVNPRGDFGNL